VARRLIIRIVLGVLTVFGVAVLTFLLEFVVPGNAAHAIAPRASAVTLREITDQLHLNAPVWIQFGDYMNGLVHGNLGESYVQREPVSTLIGQRLPATALLAGAGVLVEVVVGSALGIAAGLRRWMSRTVNGISLIFLSIPTFVLGLFLLLIFGFDLNIAPVTGGMSFGALVLPALTLGLGGVPWYAQIVRDQVFDSLSSSYVRTAIAKGLPDRWIIVRHVLRNALSPALTMVGMDLGIYISGVVVVETVFGWPGLGQLAVQALDNLDRPVVMGTTLVGAAAVVAMNIIVDIVRMYFDPRTVEVQP
jgi:ABC-type dipeptide/oligopeptide/nickel transport system permease component